MVRKGLKHGAGDTVTENEIVRALLHGEMEMWAVHDGTAIIAGIVLQVVRRERGTALIVVLIAGRSFSSWAPCVQQLIKDYANLIGAYTIEAVCREGMAKLLYGMGWKRKATTMRLENHGR